MPRYLVPALTTLLAAGAVAQSRLPVMITFRDNVAPTVLAEFGIQARGEVFGAPIAIADVAPAMVSRLRRHPAIAAVEIDHVASVYGPGRGGSGGGGGGGSTVQSTPPGIVRVGGAAGSAGVTVAVIDTGIDLTHPDLAGNIVGSVNFVNTNSANDDNGHGSHCAGTIAAINNTQGVVGVAPNASLLAVKVLDRRGSGSYSAITSGINWAAANGANILSMSLGGSASNSAMQTACNTAAQSCFVVAAAGNSGDCNLSTNEINYPAYYSSVLSVGATSVDPASLDALMCFSSSNPDVELSAPGADILSTWKSGGYNTISGTSMACPHVAGCAAVLWNGNPSTVRNTLINYADDAGPVGRDNGWGYGVAEHADID
jgi:subtilisin family serine protease